MKGAILEKKIGEEERNSKEKTGFSAEDLGHSRPLSRKAKEMKIFLERNSVPKEFLKS